MSNFRGCGIPTQIETPGTFSLSVGVSVPLKYASIGISMGWSGGGTSFPIYDKSDADPEPGEWKFATAYEIKEKPNGARLSITGTETQNFYPDNVNTINIQNQLVLFSNTTPEIDNYDYRPCSVCCR